MTTRQAVKNNAGTKISLLSLLFLFLFLIFFPVVTYVFSESKSFFLASNFVLAKTIFLGILLESLPFVLLGVTIASFIQVFMTEERMARLMPKGTIGRIGVASLLGFVLPVCDCGTVPVARGLLLKGIPVSAAITFVMAAPVVNPITMIATYVAFGLSIKAMLLRSIATLVIAILIGLVVHLRVGSKQEKKSHYPIEIDLFESSQPPRRKPLQIVRDILDHTVIEFFSVGGFVIISAIVAAVVQVYVPKAWLVSFTMHPYISIMIMMLLAVIFSLCSGADAFVARSFLNITTPGAILGFLVIGQMIDIRNLLLLPKTFSGRVMRTVLLTSILLTFAAAICVNLWYPQAF